MMPVSGIEVVVCCSEFRRRELRIFKQLEARMD
jgi:hypothetical protein